MYKIPTMSTITNMVKIQNFEVISEKFNVLKSNIKHNSNL